ncbi:O-acetyl-ADP-ribose deacetylase [Phenylobacterium aquaticum]|uniref:O-acetyl-ADP-ribose deacetylase n=1 Tax=Phenylobacterium aquaticum TaxID=1763816 RepID=UPI001F5C0E02|nr:O-acetyl-ADP-ribose deacetylase [Phenylobacterium aquaticum]MCI3132333.1 O-acetyl-ADP-ribose deacetylase [Phenylobacterium aquaticum]
MEERITGRMDVILGDITALALDAIVNAANTSLLGGGGVDGAIHRKAGPELAIQCRMLHGCKVGQAKITPGFRLPAQHVIHTVGPVWNGGGAQEDALLQQCYSEALKVAVANGIKTLAFPAISTGIYRFPADRAAKIAVEAVGAFLTTDRTIEKVTFCCFDAAAQQRHVQALAEYSDHG